MHRTAAFITLAIASPVWAQLTTINFDNAPGGIFLPSGFYAPLGVTIRTDPPGGLGNTELTLDSMAALALPAPAAGKVVIPYANLAGFLSPFLFEFSTPVEYFSLYAFGDQAFTVHAGTQVLNIPAEPGRLLYHIELDGGPAHQPFNVVRITPTMNFPFQLDPSTGPGYYDQLSFRPIPAPGAIPLLPAVALFFQRRRR